MPSPIRYEILKRMQVTLAEMSVQTGYYFDVGQGCVITDPTVNVLTGGPAGSKPFYVLQPELGGSREYFPADQIRDTYIVSVMARYDIDDNDDRASVWEKLAADIEKCLAPRADGTVWHDGLAVDARLGEPQPWVAVGSKAVVMIVTVTMRLWRGYGQPSINV